MKSINTDKEFCTNSVLTFLKENINLVYEYINKAREYEEPLSYSGMLRLTISGDTKEGVKLNSRMVERSKLTKFIEEVAENEMSQGQGVYKSNKV